MAAAGHRFLSFEDWRTIERAERERGHMLDKPAEKFVRVDEMLSAAGG